MGTEHLSPTECLNLFKRGGTIFGGSKLLLAPDSFSGVPSKVLFLQENTLPAELFMALPGAYSVRLHQKPQIIFFYFALLYNPYGPTFAHNWVLQ